jgi:hypothetical protein
VRENEGVAARILLDFDADAEKIRNEIIRMLGGPGQRQTDEGFPPGKDLGIELRLRRVVPVAQQMSDGTWVVSVEVWDHGLVVRWATSERWPLRAPELHGWGVSDDVGTSYAQVVGTGAAARSTVSASTPSSRLLPRQRPRRYESETKLWTMSFRSPSRTDRSGVPEHWPRASDVSPGVQATGDFKPRIPARGLRGRER